MKRALILTTILVASTTFAQEANPTQQAEKTSDGSTPLYRVNVVARTTKAVNYGHRALKTKIDFAGTLLARDAKGDAWIESKRGAVEVKAKFKKLPPPQHYGRQYLTYVLWAVTPDGRATNLGEILTNSSDNGKLETATELQTFALIVTAEPYYAVTQPSDVVVMENVVRPDTVGSVQTVDAKYELLKRGEYTFDLDAANARTEAPGGRSVSQKEYESLVEIYQAINAIQLAQAKGAAEHAGDTLARAKSKLEEARQAYAADPKGRQAVTLAREATQTAEDARLIAERKSE